MFNDNQIMVIEDKVINKLMFPMHYLAKLRASGSADAEVALRCLNELVHWVRGLRHEAKDN